MKIALTLDNLISDQPLSRGQIDDDLFCLNQMAREQSWYAANRWFLSGNDVFFITSRSNREMTDRWLDEWTINYNRVIYGIPFGYHYNTAIALGAYIFITPSLDEIPKAHEPEIRTFLYSQEPVSTKIHKDIIKIHDLYDIDSVINEWPLQSRKSSVRIVGQSRTLRT